MQAEGQGGKNRAGTGMIEIGWAADTPMPAVSVTVLDLARPVIVMVGPWLGTDEFIRSRSRSRSMRIGTEGKGGAG